MNWTYIFRSGNVCLDWNRRRELVPTHGATLWNKFVIPNSEINLFEFHEGLFEHGEPEWAPGMRPMVAELRLAVDWTPDFFLALMQEHFDLGNTHSLRCYIEQLRIDADPALVVQGHMETFDCDLVYDRLWVPKQYITARSIFMSSGGGYMRFMKRDVVDGSVVLRPIDGCLGKEPGGNERLDQAVQIVRAQSVPIDGVAIRLDFVRPENGPHRTQLSVVGADLGWDSAPLVARIKEFVRGSAVLATLPVHSGEEVHDDDAARPLKWEHELTEAYARIGTNWM